MPGGTVFNGNHTEANAILKVVAGHGVAEHVGARVRSHRTRLVESLGVINIQWAAEKVAAAQAGPQWRDNQTGMERRIRRLQRSPINPVFNVISVSIA